MLPGRKPKWLPRLLELLREKGSLTRSAIRSELGCPESSLTETLTRALEEGKIETEVKARFKQGKIKTKAKNQLVYRLSQSQAQTDLKNLITNALEPLSLHPLPTVSTSYTTFSHGWHTIDALLLEDINLILHDQFSCSMRQVWGRFVDQSVRLKELFVKVALHGLAICLESSDSSVRRPIEHKIEAHPEKLRQIVHDNLDLLLTQSLRNLAPSFAQKKAHLQLLAFELQRILPLESFPATFTQKDRELSRFSSSNLKMLMDFLGKVSEVKFMVMLPFGFPELDEIRLQIETEILESFNLWMRKLKEGTLDLEHSSFLFIQGARNLKRFIVALKNPDFKKLKRVLKPRPAPPMEVDLHLVMDLREQWDLRFLHEKHAQGKQPELYSEILSLIRKRRKEASNLRLPENATVNRVVLTRKGFLVYYEGQEQPEIIGPDNANVR